MRKFLIFLVVLVLLWGVAEFVAGLYAENEIEERVADKVTAEVDAEVDSFPVATRLVALEEVGRIAVTLSNADFEEMVLDTLTVEATGLEIPRERLFDGKVRPTSIESGSVTAFISTASIGEALGTTLPNIDPDSATATLENGTLTLEVGGAPPASVQVPTEALPCSATGEIVNDGVRIRCEVDEIPGVILDNIPR